MRRNISPVVAIEERKKADMSAATLTPFVVVLFLGFSFLHDFHLHVSSTDVGFYAKLIHRDSPESPFHDPNTTLFSRNRAAILRSANHKKPHTNFLDPNFDNIISSILVGSKFQYIMLIEIGTPPRLFFGLVDSGSDLIWMLCSPCQNCYEHDGRIFKPKESSTYDFHPCRSDECSMLRHTPCHGRRPRCEYNYKYADGSSLEGILSTETLSFNSAPGIDRGKFKVPGIFFGCTHKTQGNFNYRSTGIIGLGAGGLSLIRQLGPHGGNKFSYCLPSTENKATRIYFGSAAVVSGPNAVSTPLHITNPPESLYTIELERIHVTNSIRTTIIVPRGPRIPRDNLIFIDSGVVMTYIKPGMMSDLSDTLETYIPNQRVDVPQKVAQYIDLCFNSQPTQEMPVIKFEFNGGATVALKSSNIFRLVSPEALCLTISSNDHFEGESMFGSRAQSTTRIGYDLDARRLTFLPDGC